MTQQSTPPDPSSGREPLVDLLRRAQPHLFAVDRKGWCWCADNQPDRDPGDHNADCKWIADVKRVGGLRGEIQRVLDEVSR